MSFRAASHVPDGMVIPRCKVRKQSLAQVGKECGEIVKAHLPVQRMTLILIGTCWSCGL